MCIQNIQISFIEACLTTLKATFEPLQRQLVLFFESSFDDYIDGHLLVVCGILLIPMHAFMQTLFHPASNRKLGGA